MNNDMLVDSDFDDKQQDVAVIHADADDAMDETSPQPMADDFEAMRDHFMPYDPELEVESETISTWDIKDWRTMPKRSHSPIFKCGEHPWKVLFFPAGNNAAESVSFYLEQGYTEDDKPPEDWYACARFMLVLWNPNDPSIYLHHEANHRFNAEEGDWGFTRFAEKNKIFSSRFENKDRPLVEGDTAKVTAYVRVYKDPTGVLWHNFSKSVLITHLLDPCQDIQLTRTTATIPKRRLAWSASATKVQPATLILSYSLSSLPTRSVRYDRGCGCHIPWHQV